MEAVAEDKCYEMYKLMSVDGLNKSMLTTLKRLQNYTYSWNKFALIFGMLDYYIAGYIILEILNSLFFLIIAYLEAV